MEVVFIALVIAGVMCCAACCCCCCDRPKSEILVVNKFYTEPHSGAPPTMSETSYEKV